MARVVIARVVKAFFLLFVLFVCTAVVHQLEYDPTKYPLKFEGGIKGSPKVYPGQRFNVYYRIDYHGEINLTKEELPLLNIQGMKKIGGVQVNEGNEGAYHYQEFIQTYEKLEVGKTEIDASHIQGVTKLEGKEIKVALDLPAQTLEVLPFPEKGKPPSFNGALGPQTLEVYASPAQVAEGDLIALKILVSAPDYPSTIRYPDIACQSGFSGFFQISTFSSNIQANGASVSFEVEMRPLSASITEIPPIELTYFNPVNQKYEKVFSKAFAIQVKPLEEKLEPLRELEVSTDWKAYFAGAAEEEVQLNEELQKSLASKNYEQAGNILEKFQQYPFAAYYYYKQILQHPEIGNVKEKLQVVLDKLQVKPIALKKEHSRLWAYVGVGILLLGGALFIYGKKKSATVLGALGVVVFLGAVVIYYQQPPVGMLVEEAFMHQMANPHAPYVRPQPIKAGEGVEILGLEGQQPWVKVRIQAGEVGYVRADAVRLLF